MNQQRLAQWGVLLITLLATALRLYQLGVKSFWFDECFTYSVTAILPLDRAWEAIVEDAFHPPLYFLLVRLLLTFAGISEYAARFLSAALGVMTVPVIYQVGRRFGGESVGIVAALLLAVNPFHVWYSQEARTYAPMLLFSLAAMDRFILLLRGRRAWGSFIACSAPAYAMFYASTLLIYVQLVCLLPHLRRTRLVRGWFLAQATALVPLALWMIPYYVARGVWPAGLRWIPRPGPLAPLYTLWNFTTIDVETLTPAVALLAAGTALVFAAGLFPWSEERRRLVWWLALPIGFVFLLSLRRPYYADRYLLTTLPAYLLLLALGITARRAAIWRLLTASVVLAAMGWGTLRLYTDPHFVKEDWRGVTAAIETELASTDIVVMEGAAGIIGTWAYRTREWPYAVLWPGEESKTLEEAAAQHGRVWLVWWSSRVSNHRVYTAPPFDVFAEAPPIVREWLAAHRQQVAFDLRLPGLSVVRVDQ